MLRWRQCELILLLSMRALLNTKIHLCMIRVSLLFVILKELFFCIKHKGVSPNHKEKET